MPYDTTAGDAPAGADLEAGAAAPAEKGGEAGGDIYIPSDMLPSGIKDGDVLRVVSMDENGCTFVHEPSEAADEQGESWEEGFRKEMSPSSPQEGAM